jgi:hypothetical protein
LPCNGGQTEQKVGSLEDLDAATFTNIRELAKPNCKCKKDASGFNFEVQQNIVALRPKATRNHIFNMNVQEQIQKYITSQPEPKRSDMQALHRTILEVMPGCKLWFLDGKNSENKTVSNPNIGYGLHTIKYADGTTREFYQIGLSANKTGISVYILGIEDKKYLAQTYGKELGKASVTGYCIRFKTLKDINIEILEAAIRSELEKSRLVPLDLKEK